MSEDWIIRLDGSSLPDRALIGGKAWSIAHMQSLGLAVPPAFVINTRACLAFLDSGSFPNGLDAELTEAIGWLESQSGRTLGRGPSPLLLSVRSGAAVSMPGMMDTVLNLGINGETQAALASETGLDDFARDTRRRFLELYCAIVLGLPVELEKDSDPDGWLAAISNAGGTVPDDPRKCLDAAITAVFASWNTRRARKYRQHNNIADDLGTAVTVQSMVFGNLDDTSGTGVLFSRNPLTGEAKLYGEYLPRAQGEDVVSGKFTPLPLTAMTQTQPAAFAALEAAAATLERENRDIQDIEFTVQSGRLYLLQARSAKRAPDAAVTAALDMVDEQLIDIATALARVTPEQIATLLLPRLTASEIASATLLASGEGACPGAATGVCVTDPDEAERRAATGEKVILLRATTSPDDIHGMIAAGAVITEQGGSTSHAAVVSRALGRPCVVGIGSSGAVKAGDVVTVDGGAGRIYAGALGVARPDEHADPRLARLIGWASERTEVHIDRLESDSSGHNDAIDVDALIADGSVDGLGSKLAGHTKARGLALASPDMARQAVTAGVRHLITRPVLPALLALVNDQQADAVHRESAA